MSHGANQGNNHSHTQGNSMKAIEFTTLAVCILCGSVEALAAEDKSAIQQSKRIALDQNAALFNLDAADHIAATNLLATISRIASECLQEPFSTKSFARNPSPMFVLDEKSSKLTFYASSATRCEILLRDVDLIGGFIFHDLDKLFDGLPEMTEKDRKKLATLKQATLYYAVVSGVTKLTTKGRVKWEGHLRIYVSDEKKMKQLADALSKLQRLFRPADAVSRASRKTVTPVITSISPTVAKIPAANIAKAGSRQPEPLGVTEELLEKGVAKEGWLRQSSTGKFKKPGTHQLMGTDKPMALILSFLSCTTINLDQYEGKHVRVTGDEYKHRGWNQPHIRVTKVEPIK